MLIELGNHARLRALDDRPAVTTFHIPEADHDGLGGFTHNPGAVSPGEFKEHFTESMLYRNGITRLPDNEIILAVVNAWALHSYEKPAWVNVLSMDETHGADHGANAHSREVCDDVEIFLREFYQMDGDGQKPADVEQRYWTRFGPPGQGGPELPELQMLYTNAGRVIDNNHDGGGIVGTTGSASAATATTLTVAAAPSSSFVGYRIYALATATGPIVWGNITASSGTTITVDQWYNAATPGGAAATTPSATTIYWVIADGGAGSCWFVGLNAGSGAYTPAAADTALAAEYRVGTPAGVTSAAGFLRKIATVSSTQGTASRNVVLSIPGTATSGDVFPTTFNAIGVFASNVYNQGLMKFETALNANATINATGDQVNVTETITGS